MKIDHKHPLFKKAILLDAMGKAIANVVSFNTRTSEARVILSTTPYQGQLRAGLVVTSKKEVLSVKVKIPGAYLVHKLTGGRINLESWK